MTRAELIEQACRNTRSEWRSSTLGADPLFRCSPAGGLTAIRREFCRLLHLQEFLGMLYRGDADREPLPVRAARLAAQQQEAKLADAAGARPVKNGLTALERTYGEQMARYWMRQPPRCQPLAEIAPVPAERRPELFKDRSWWP